MSYQVLARKWRPRSFSEMVGQEHVLKALINALDHKRLHHAYLFTGTRGVGKTTVARILAKCLNCETGIGSSPCGVCSTCTQINEGRFVDLIEVDAASRTKVEDTRELLDNVQYSPTSGRFKIYLIDEVHMLSNSSFNALLKTLEEPPEHVKFLLATTDPQRLPATILSRCLQFNLKNMSAEKIVAHLETILKEEAVPYQQSALWQLARGADGSMRDALSLTDQAIAYGNGKLDEADVSSMLGTIDHKFIQTLIEALSKQDGARMLKAVAAFSEHAPDYSAALADLQSYLHRIAIAQALPEALDNSYGDRQQVLNFSTQLTPEDVQLFYQTALVGQRDLKLSSVPRAGFEMVLLRMLAFKPQVLVDVPKNALPTVSVTEPTTESTIEPTPGPTTEPSIDNAGSQLQQPTANSGEGQDPEKKPERSLDQPASGELSRFSRASTNTHEYSARPVESARAIESNPAVESNQQPVATDYPHVNAELAPEPEPEPEPKANTSSSDAMHLHGVSRLSEADQLNQAPEPKPRMSVESLRAEIAQIQNQPTTEHKIKLGATESIEPAQNEAIQPDSTQPDSMQPESIQAEAIEAKTGEECAELSAPQPGHTEQSHADQRHAEQSHAEQSHAEQSHADQSVRENEHAQAVVQEPEPQHAPRISLDEFQPTQWITLFFKLPLKGVARMTASNLVCRGLDANTFYFLQDERAGGLLNTEHAQFIAEALTDYFSVQCKAEIAVAALPGGAETPAQFRERRRQERKQAAIEQLRQDPIVVSLTERFGAQLVEDSVKVEEERI